MPLVETLCYVLGSMLNASVELVPQGHDVVQVGGHSRPFHLRYLRFTQPILNDPSSVWSCIVIDELEVRSALAVHGYNNRIYHVVQVVDSSDIG